MEQTTLSVSFPRLIVNVYNVGTNSLVGSLCKELQERNLLKDVGILIPDEIVFVINSVNTEVNLYHEINQVRDILKIDEKKITLFIKTKN